MRYYSIYGDNGLGVMSSWEGVCKREKYFQSVHYKRFDKFSLAEAYSINGFKERVCKTNFRNCKIPEILQLNQLIFAKNIIDDSTSNECS